MPTRPTITAISKALLRKLSRKDHRGFTLRCLGWVWTAPRCGWSSSPYWSPKHKKRRVSIVDKQSLCLHTLLSFVAWRVLCVYALKNMFLGDVGCALFVILVLDDDDDNCCQSKCRIILLYLCFLAFSCNFI